MDSGLRAEAYTRQPLEARCSAVARPMPDEHPVMRTAFETVGGMAVALLDRAAAVSRA
jgi:hypothetical protein